MDNFSNYSNQNYNNPDQRSPRENRGGEKNTPVILSVILLIIIVLLGYLVLKSANKISGPEATVERLPDGNLLKRAGGDNIIAGFPTEIPVETSANISESYSIQYINDDKSLPVVNYKSNLTLAENIAKFGNYMKGSGWEIMHEADADEGVTFLYGKRENEDLNITFDNRTGEVLVTIAYSS
jgi:hypothetical protein